MSLGHGLGQRATRRLGPHEQGELAAWLRAVDEGRLSRREFLIRATALGVSLSTVGMALAACGGKKAAAGGGGAAIDQTKPASIRFYNWTEYTSPAVLKRFELEQGIKVQLNLYDSNEQLDKALTSGAGPYDVIIPEDAWVTIFSKAGLIRPLDLSLIPNFGKYVTGIFRAPPFDSGAGGTKYSVPYMFGSIGLAVRLDKIPDPPNSWAVAYDKRYKGQISLLEGAHEVLGPALMLLGYSYNSTSQDELDQATAKAIAQKPLVKTYSSTGMANRILAGLPVVQCWDGDAVLAMNKAGISKIRYILPDEGYNVWMDGVCVPTSAASAYGAHLFLNFLLDPRNAADSANYIGYQPAVEAADPMVKSLVQRAMRPTQETLENGTFSTDLGAFEDAYQAAYKKVMAA